MRSRKVVKIDGQFFFKWHGMKFCGEKQKQKETQELSVCQYTDYVVTGGAGGCHRQRQPLLQPVTIKLASWHHFSVV